ncbi:uncharacterized protein BCR38DRAFT_348044 [Pseudomassariella vexata]|uniref:Dimethylaniline monooxygenase n=1 Tax=Pseudomassariella vexata TaxID=1141098 RepID=A0A1Y2DQV5_9PEZI|nr:uncharacterized protein BCR38DRAFT_348044 [Pseudomassariella vexata]ORY61559.1 hypothetical protein BCR38DRAFT_348044 [Pseudomassariella vexata]
MVDGKRIRSVAVVGAGAAGAITAAALKAENYFERIRVFERRERPGGTWIYDEDPKPSLDIYPGSLPPDIDRPLKIPDSVPSHTPPSCQERYVQTPVYKSLTTNVPDIAMCYSDARFPYGPFVPHYIPRQYVENYFSTHKTDSFLQLNTTVEDMSKVNAEKGGNCQWKLTLRTYDPARHIDIWWDEIFDAVVLGNGHYSVPYVPHVDGLDAYLKRFPGRVVHSKYYRSPLPYASKKVLIIGNSASGHDISNELVTTASHPVYQSIRSKSIWDGDEPPAGIVWKPVIKEFLLDGRIMFKDGTYLDSVDTVIYCTGYKPSYPFWNIEANGRPLWDYEAGKMIKTYWHTFFQDFPTLAIVGAPRVLTFRSFEYQAIALARLFAGRHSVSLPPIEEQKKWEKEREQRTKREGLKFHDIEWETGETMEWLRGLFQIAGLGTLRGEGRIPPFLGEDMIWAIEHIKKYPEPGNGRNNAGKGKDRKGQEGVEVETEEEDWVLVERKRKDLLAFI